MEQCGNCGKEIDLSPYDPGGYVYKTTKKVKGTTKTTYFCGYKCRQAAMLKYYADLERKKKEAAEKTRRTREQKKGDNARSKEKA